MSKSIGESLGTVKLGKSKVPVILLLIGGVGGVALLLGNKKQSSSDSGVDNPGALQDSILSNVNGVLAAQSQSNQAALSGIADQIQSSIERGFNSSVRLMPPVTSGLSVSNGGNNGVYLPPSSTPTSNPFPVTPQPDGQITFDRLNQYLANVGANYRAPSLSNDVLPTNAPNTKGYIPIEFKPYYDPNMYTKPAQGQIWFSPDSVSGHESLVNVSDLPHGMTNMTIIGSKQLQGGPKIDVWGYPRNAM